MAVDIYLDPITGDVDITNGIMRLTRNKEEVSRQQVLISLNTFQGEWIYNILAGIPWLRNKNNPIQLLGAGNNLELIKTLVREDVLNREFVVDVGPITTDLDIRERTLSISFEFTTENGEVIEVNLPAPL